MKSKPLAIPSDVSLEKHTLLRRDFLALHVGFER